MKKLLFFFIILTCNIINVFAQQDYRMSTSATYSTCSGNFYDDGGPDSSYKPNQNELVTLKPPNSSNKLSVTFNSFQVNYGADTLFVYNGDDTTAPLIGKLVGAAGYGTITSSANDGSLTFKFISDGGRNAAAEAGWAAVIACNITPTDITMLASGTFITCSGNFYDGGGPNGSYMPKQDVITTLKPPNSSNKLSVTFNSFQADYGADTLFVYDGDDTTAPLIGKLVGAAGYGTITSSANDGSLTFKFISDGGRNAAAEAGWAAVIACNITPTDITMLASGTFITCSGNFYDGGGPNGSYMPKQDVITTLKPPNSSNKLSVTFNSFQAGYGADTLFVYDGDDTTAPLIGKLVGAAGYGTITSSANDGSLTFKFISDGGRNAAAEAGWAAVIACNITPTDITMLASGTFITCSGNFYDGGGPNGSYMPKQDVITTLKPPNSSNKLSVTFNSFQADYGADTLFVYNGDDTTAPLIGKLVGAAGYGTITSSANDGSLTFKFISDGGRNAAAEAGWAAVIACNITPADITMLASGTFITCSGNFYDGGGPNGSYMPKQDVITTLKPPNSSNKLSVTFNSFQAAGGADTLFVYNGDDTTAPLIGKLHGSVGYGTITSSANDGSLTFKFISDGVGGSDQEAGWSATIACNITPTDITMLASGTFVTCSGNFYDGGGPNGSYMPKQDVITTLKPPNSSNKLSVTFNSFQAAGGADTLFVYNGDDTTAHLIGKLVGSAGYGTITSSANDGSLTFKFISDGVGGSDQEAGWSATIACNITPTDITMLASGTFVTCSGNFYDGGGPNGSYMPKQDVITTLKPPNSTSKLSVTFSSFQAASGADTLFVYNGDDTTAHLIGKLVGSAGYGTITSSANDGSLTFKFISDGGQSPSLEAGWSATIACNITPTDITMLASGTFVTCSGNFYDGGGPNGNYMPKQDVITTLKPPNSSNKLSVKFNSFQASYGTDTLFVYNGDDTTSPLISKLSGNLSPQTITSTAIDGSLTFKFISDGSQAANFETGWAATIACNITPYQVPFLPPSTAIKLPGDQATTPEPIQLGTGTYYYKHTDINIPAINSSLNFTRVYNSLNGAAAGPLGNGWSHTYNYYLDNRGDTAWDIHYPDGHLATFIPMNALGQSFPIFSGTTDSLQKNSNDSYSLFTKEKLQYHFDAAGKLDSIIDLDSNITQLHYTGNLLNSIVAPGGRSLVLTYSGNNISSVTDPLGRICNYTYDGNNNLITVKDANNGTASFTYDNEHRMLTAVNPLGDVIVDNTYDGTGKVISQKDAYNQVTSIAYNFPNTGDATVTNPDNSQMVAHHDNYIRKTSIKDEMGFTKIFAYDVNSNENRFTNEDNQSETRLFDNKGDLLSDTLPGSKITNITYNSFNSPVQVKDAKGNQRIFYYNSSNNNLDSIRNPDNSLQFFYYNSEGQVIQSIDGNGNVTTYTYSGEGDLLSVKTFAGIKQFTYDAAGRKVSSTDENGHTTTYEYDNDDNLTKITDPLGRTIENTYDANNQLLSVKDKKGFITTYTYDKKGRKITSTNPRAGITTYAYDVRDNLISVTDPDNHVVTYAYDKKGRKTSATDALGTNQYQYDGVGNLIEVIDPTNKTTEYTYTATNKKQSQKDGLGNTTNYGYDADDNLASVADPLNRITAYGYDVMNRLVSVEDAAKKTTSVTYDKNGNKKTVADPNGHTQTYNYDAANRLISYHDAAGNNYTYSYDSAGNIKTLTKPTGTIGKVYDAGNRTITVNNSTGDNYHFTYDNNNNIITMSNNAGTTTMTYDSLNQLKQYQDPFNNTVSFTHDKAGNKTSIIYPGSKTVSYTYDAANNLKSVTDWLGHTFTYTYDAAGRVTQMLYPNAAHCNYGFDNAGRLISKINSLSNNTGISGSIFTLDGIGNRTTEQRIGQVPSALLSLSRAYSYENDDKMLSDSIWNFMNDNSGNRTSETNGIKTASYTFSVDNLLNSWIDTSGNNNTYSYDPLGDRISKVVGANSNRYILDVSNGLSQILQITDAGGVVKSNYVYGLGLLESIDATNNPLYYHFDAQHNTTALTDVSEVIKDTYTYDPFGTLLNHAGTTTQPFTFLGEYGVEQESSALYYAHARYYDAANGRFLSKDAYPFDLNYPQTIDKYVYGVNNPAINYDPSGFFNLSTVLAPQLQLWSGLGNLAAAGLLGYASRKFGPILGPGAIQVSGYLLNNATKDFQAYYVNSENMFNSNIAWTPSEDFNGLLGSVYNDPYIKLSTNGFIIALGVNSLYELFKYSPEQIAKILTINKSTSEILSILQKYILGKNSPILNLDDIREAIKTLFEEIETLSLSTNYSLNNNAGSSNCGGGGGGAQ